MARNPKTPQMLTHEQIWNALDRLAERAGLSASGLAKKSGLDPTTFTNPSASPPMDASDGLRRNR
jgi:phage repressor protein C with HTH and peptisase S24 domain